MITALCQNCIYLDDAADKLTCKAFPKGIPIEILKGEVDHRNPYKGDNGITYKGAGKNG